MNDNSIKKHAKNVLEKVMRKTWKFHEKGSQKESQNPLKNHKKGGQKKDAKLETPPGQYGRALGRVRRHNVQKTSYRQPQNSKQLAR